ncbi:unnamed protein product [Chondrus crispus]|uniref:Uncharacterized protein n=1 Tax=Chondrus crispus TaxID=2769 RepID=R7QBN1_CHOCR|nr:unnamed protein product [Chondrus crispus]CDF35907.1 unnamed protein product [Chondrus crispus]|eukprot:XP_005715726.1 unnamed protein product [Chondrus crispus]
MHVKSKNTEQNFNTGECVLTAAHTRGPAIIYFVRKKSQKPPFIRTTCHWQMLPMVHIKGKKEHLID